MKTKENLFRLIKSLSPSEKRYFIMINTTGNAKEKNYIKLFKEIDKQIVYDEKQIKAKFKNEAFTKQFWVAKNYLYNLILKSLASYKGNSTKLSRFTKEINKVEILYNKGLYNEAYEISTSLKKQLIEDEMFAELIMLITLEIPMIKYVHETGDLSYDRIEGKMEAEYYLHLLSNFIKYQSLNNEFYEIFVKRIALTENQSELFVPIMENELIKNKNKAITERSRQIRYFIRSVCGMLGGNIDDAIENSALLVESSLSNQNLLTNTNSLCLAIYNHIIILCEKKKPDVEKAQYYLNILQEESLKETDSKRFALEKYYLAAFRLIQFTMDEKKIDLLTNDMVRFVTTNFLGEAFENRSYYAISTLYFYRGNFKEALKYANLLLNKNRNLVEDDHLIFAHIMKLICSYELNYTEVLPSYFRSSCRFLRKSNIRSKSVELLLKLIQTQFQNFSSQKRHLKALMETLGTFNKSDLTHFEQRYFYLAIWVSSKLKDRPFIEVYKEKYLNR